MTKLTKTNRKNGELIITFRYPVKLFDYLILLVGTFLITLSVMIFNKNGDILNLFLISIPGLFGGLLFFGFLELMALNFRTLKIDKNGIVTIGKLFRKVRIDKSQILAVKIYIKKDKGIINSSGFFQGPNIISATVNLELINRKTLEIIPIRGQRDDRQNSRSRMLQKANAIAKQIANPLGLKIERE